MAAFAGDLKTIPARFGAAIPVDKGRELVVVNTHGTQVMDCWAFSRADVSEFMSMEHTRSKLSKVVPAVGDALVTTRRRPILTVTEDTSPGIHDTLLCACSPEIYEEHGCPPGHRSCEQNLHEALAEIGLSCPCTPPPFNLFMNVAVGPANEVLRDAPRSKPGDYIRLRAEMDAVVVLSACPQDVTVINGPSRTPREVQYAVV